MCVLGSRVGGVAISRGREEQHLRMPLSLLKEHLQMLTVYSSGKWFYKVLGRTISLKFSVDFNDQRIIQNIFQNADWKGVWSGLEFSTVFLDRSHLQTQQATLAETFSEQSALF